MLGRLVRSVVITLVGLPLLLFPPQVRAQAVAPEIVELARSLKGDPDLIFEYVYNNIRTLPMRGSIKGALGALLDGYGTSYDQAELMVLLLRQSGYTANFALGSVHLAGAEAANWLGTDTTPGSITAAMFYGGFTYGFDLNPDGSLHDINFSWAWVQANIPGSSCSTTCVFDPATKFGMGAAGYSHVSGMSVSVLQSAMGYNRSSFLTNAAAVTTTSPWALTSLNRTNIRNDLTAYASNLVQYIRSNNPAASTTDIIGGVTGITALPLGTQYRSGGIPRQFASSYTVSPDIPSSARVTLTQQFGYINSSGAFVSLVPSALTLNAADVYGHRMTVAFSSSSVASLLVDGVAQMTATAAPPSGTDLTIRTSMSYLWRSDLNGYPGYTNKDDAHVRPGPNAVYAVTPSWGPVGRSTVERRKRLLQQAIADNPGNPVAEAVIGESYSILAYTYAAEYWQHQRLLSQLSGVVPMQYYLYGTYGSQTLGGVTGPFMSLWARAERYSQAIGRSSPLPIGFTQVETNAFLVESLASSVTESAMLRQTQSGMPAVSTVEVIDRAIQQGIRIFDINNNAISGNDVTYYNNVVKGLMTASGWSTGDQSAVTANVNNSERILAPESGSIAISQFRGTGWFRLVQAQGYDGGMGGSISGNLHGGMSGDPVQIDHIPPNGVYNNGAPTYDFSVILIPGTGQGDAGGLQGDKPSSVDPINLVTGDSFFDTTDLRIGSRDTPYGLAFRRYYDSGTRLEAGTLGNGWTHSFDVTALVNSDPYEGLAANSPINGAAAIVGTIVALDMGSMDNLPVGRPIERFVTGAVIYRWVSDNVTDNIVAVKQPGSIEHFVKLADGTYNPPPGSGATLSFNGAAFTYAAKDLMKWAFNADGALGTLTSPAGPVVTLSYSGSPSILSTVTNNLGRSLSFSYTSGQLTQVTDDSGRSVSYAYDASNNLTSFIDTLGQATTYSYDLPGRMTQMFYPWAPNQAYVTNVYDSLSRVRTQANVFGATWNYFFAGSRSEEVDPLGMRHVLYNSTRGKTLMEIQDLQGPNQSIMTNSWDALDRLMQSTMPEGNSASYTYDIKSNVLTVTKTPKPGSPLTALTATATYDPTFNKPLTVTEPLGRVTTMSYDAITGSLLSVIGDAATLKATTRYTYTSLGLPRTTTDPVGTVTLNNYDGFGNLTSTVQDSGAGRLNLMTSYVYDARG
ncbi:MAG: RHS repeat protein [Reyranella sp.]|uniref:DUF6531 domain-containing protein n=1 Tax=Reyranella sp. TaxID=1929291 RepID=UPI001AD1C361|nr:DUF6531 domain-containing protein [Reyranella sp.]MBN9090095.1 RHS repeat protein [Reyranella sp.]